MAEAKVCPPQVLALVDHLRSTGTGQSKLDKITELGKVTKNLDEFLSMLPSNVPPATLSKVDEYLGKVVCEKEEKVSGEKLQESWLATEKGKALQRSHKQAAAKAQGKGATTTETRSEYQSSIPEHTILQENKNPVLKPEGGQSKQLGADVEVPSEKKLTEDDEEDLTETSEVSDVNADEAKDKISRMTSKKKLQHIANNDTRKTVKEAAELRLMEIEEKEKNQ